MTPKEITPVTGIHHINLLVADLDHAMTLWRQQLGISDFIEDSLEGRGVRTARVRLGHTWLVLVQPVSEGEPMRQLRERGEGLFLLSLGVSNLDDAVATVKKGGGDTTSIEPRQGLENWRVIDLDPSLLAGAPIQLTEEQ